MVCTGFRKKHNFKIYHSFRSYWNFSNPFNGPASSLSLLMAFPPKVWKKVARHMDTEGFAKDQFTEDPTLGTRVL
jgi:hypothetical protein